MSRVWSRLTGGAAGGNYQVGDRATRLNFFQPDKDDLDLAALGCLCRNRYVGGSDVIGIPANTAGTFDLINRLPPFEIDNLNNQWSGFTDANGATLVVRIRFQMRVSDASVSVTPVIYNETTLANATISGESACSTVDPNFGDPSQKQSVILTLPTGVNLFRPRVTIGGTPTAGFQVWVTTMFDMYINS